MYTPYYLRLSWGEYTLRGSVAGCSCDPVICYIMLASCKENGTSIRHVKSMLPVQMCPRPVYMHTYILNIRSKPSATRFSLLALPHYGHGLGLGHGPGLKLGLSCVSLSFRRYTYYDS